jgi:hypothetical protein
MDGDERSEDRAVESTERGDGESLHEQLDLLTLLVAVVGLGLLVGGVAETFAALFSVVVAGFVLYRLHRRDQRS